MIVLVLKLQKKSFNARIYKMNDGGQPWWIDRDKREGFSLIPFTSITPGVIFNRRIKLRKFVYIKPQKDSFKEIMKPGKGLCLIEFDQYSLTVIFFYDDASKEEIILSFKAQVCLGTRH